MFFLICFNDTHREKLVILLNLFTQSIILIPLSYRCLKNVIHQIDNKNEWLFLSVTFTAKYELVFVRGFILKPTERGKIFLKNGTRGFQNSPPFERSACSYVTISESFTRFSYINFNSNFLGN